MKNKMISALLATAMVASMMTVPALASEGETGGSSNCRSEQCRSKRSLSL